MLLELVLKLRQQSFEELQQKTSSVTPAMTNSEFRGAMSAGSDSDFCPYGGTDERRALHLGECGVLLPNHNFKKTGGR
jgi:hypothetical protein